VNRISSVVFLLAASAAFSGAAVASSANSFDVQVKSRIVTIETSDAKSPAGVRKAFNLIRQAAEETCRTSAYPVGHEIWVQLSCESQAVAKAIQSANIPALTEFYTGKSGNAMVAGR
jgi:UrcA family protein